MFCSIGKNSSKQQLGGAVVGLCSTLSPLAWPRLVSLHHADVLSQTDTFLMPLKGPPDQDALFKQITTRQDHFTRQIPLSLVTDIFHGSFQPLQRGAKPRARTGTAIRGTALQARASGGFIAVLLREQWSPFPIAIHPVPVNIARTHTR